MTSVNGHAEERLRKLENDDQNSELGLPRTWYEVASFIDFEKLFLWFPCSTAVFPTSPGECPHRS